MQEKFQKFLLDPRDMGGKELRNMILTLGRPVWDIVKNKLGRDNSKYLDAEKLKRSLESFGTLFKKEGATNEETSQTYSKEEVMRALKAFSDFQNNVVERAEGLLKSDQLLEEENEAALTRFVGETNAAANKVGQEKLREYRSDPKTCSRPVLDAILANHNKQINKVKNQSREYLRAKGVELDNIGNNIKKLAENYNNIYDKYSEHNQEDVSEEATLEILKAFHDYQQDVRQLVNFALHVYEVTKEEPNPELTQFVKLVEPRIEKLQREYQEEERKFDNYNLSMTFEERQEAFQYYLNYPHHPDNKNLQGDKLRAIAIGLQEQADYYREKSLNYIKELENVYFNDKQASIAKDYQNVYGEYGEFKNSTYNKEQLAKIFEVVNAYSLRSLEI